MANARRMCPRNFVGLCVLLGGLGACASTPAAPFDTFKSVPITVYRLQNYEPPAQATAATTAAPNLLPALPVEIQQWVKAGASMLPAGLIPPGLIPGTAATTSSAVDSTPRFHNFRVIGSPTNVIDTKLHDEIVDIFGFSKNFDDTHGSCLYAEFGFSFLRTTEPPADVLVSFSCDQVQAQNFAWPHRSTGLTSESADRIRRVALALFGGG